MNSDIATLQNIADTLKEEPMNAVIKRFVERGWIMLTNVNLRKLSYAITPAGIAELTARSQTFAKRTFAIANKYNETLCNAVSEAKKQGKNKLVLYGNSYIKFLLIYACQTLNVTFIEKAATDQIEADAFCVVGEQCEEAEITRLTEQGCVNLLDLIEE